MKKLLTLFVLSIFIFTNLNIVTVSASNTETSKMYKQLIISKSNLSKTRKGKKYVKSIDAFIVKAKDNKKNLEKISRKLEAVLASGKIRNKETLNILKYLDAKVNVSLLKIRLVEKNAIFSDNISDENKKIIEDRIIKLQLNTVDKGENLLKVLTDKFEGLTNYEDKGNFEMDYNMNHDYIGEVKGNFKVSDYKSSVSGFDSKFEGKIEALISAILKGEEEVKLELNSMIDFISKDGNMYLLLEKFNVVDEKGMDEMKEFLDKAKEIAEKNEYIKYSDPQTQAGLQVLKSLNPTKLISDSRSKLSKPLITAYKKEGDRYLLKPTKYACDTMKELANKFDPFSPTTCTDSQYKSILEDLNESGSFYAELSGDKTKIGFIGSDEFNRQGRVDVNEGYISFDDDNILEVSYNIEGDDGKVILNYIKNNKLNFKFDIEKEGFNINLVSKLNKNNKFEEIDFDLEIKDGSENFIANLDLKDNKITGGYKVTRKVYDYNYDYETYTYDKVLKSENESFSVEISGKTDSKDSLSELNIDYIGNNYRSGEKVLDGKIRYSNKSLSFENNYEDYGIKSNMLLSGKLDNNNMINSGDIEFKVSQKGGSYNYETYEYEYSDEYQEMFNMDININNKNISGSTKVFNAGKDMLTITHKGDYGTDRFKLENNFEFSEEYSEMIGGVSDYKQDAENAKVKSDLRTIVTAIEVNVMQYNTKLSDFELDNNKIDFDVLKQKGSDFKHPDGSDYLIFTNDNEYLYQVYSYTIDSEGNKIANIRGNYYQKDSTYPESLVEIDGKIIKSGDIVGTVELTEKEEIKKISGNFNIDTDFSRNKNNIELFINTLFGEEEVFSFTMKNIGTRSYKKIDIKEPTNSIDYKEAFGIEDSYNDYNNYYY